MLSLGNDYRERGACRRVGNGGGCAGVSRRRHGARRSTVKIKIEYEDEWKMSTPNADARFPKSRFARNSESGYNRRAELF